MLAFERPLGGVGENDRLRHFRRRVCIGERFRGGSGRQLGKRRLRKPTEWRHSDANDKSLPHRFLPRPFTEADIV
jgi:hypothetical protein